MWRRRTWRGRIIEWVDNWWIIQLLTTWSLWRLIELRKLIGHKWFLPPWQQKVVSYNSNYHTTSSFPFLGVGRSDSSRITPTKWNVIRSEKETSGGCFRVKLKLKSEIRNSCGTDISFFPSFFWTQSSSANLAKCHYKMRHPLTLNPWRRKSSWDETGYPFTSWLNANYSWHSVGTFPSRPSNCCFLCLFAIIDADKSWTSSC